MTRPIFPDPSGTSEGVGASNASSATSGFDVDSLFELASMEAKSVPEEYQQHVEDFIDFAGCILGIVFSERQLAWLRGHIAEALADPGSNAANLIESSIEGFRSVKDADFKTHHAWREQNQPSFMKRISEAEDTLSQTLVEWHTAAQQVLVVGHPSLTREAAESWAELSTFAALIAQGKEPGTAVPKNLEAMIAQIANQYLNRNPQEQLQIAFAPLTLYEIRRSWPTMSADKREKLRSRLAAQFRLQAQPRTGAPQPPPIAVTPPPSQAAGRSYGWDRFRDDSSVKSLQRQLKEATEEGDRSKAVELKRKIQEALQQEGEASSMLSNTMTMRHQMMMNIIGNLKA